MRSYLGFTLFLMGCYSEPEFVAELQSMYCPALFSCYETLEADCTEIQCLYANEADCQDDWDAAYANDQGACTDEETYSAEYAALCIEKLESFDCTRLANKELPSACSQVCASND